jgi:hypothetical protein
MTFITLLLHLLLICWAAYRISLREPGLQRVFWPALTVRLISGIALGLVYLLYYGLGDTLAYAEDGATLATVAKHNPGGYLKFLWSSQPAQPWPVLQTNEPRALFMVKLVSIFSLVCFDNYWTIALYFSFFSFLGAWFLVRQIGSRLPALMPAASIAFLFFPSAAFWSSGVIKESLALAALFFLTGIFLKLWFGESVALYQWLMLLLAAWILWNLKYYFAAIFFAVAVAGLLYKVAARAFKPARFGMQALVWLVVFIIPLGIVMASRPNFHPGRIFTVIVENYHAYTQISSSDDLIHFSRLAPDAWSMAANTPWALFSGLFRPFLWEANNALQMAAAVENLFLFVLFCIALASVGAVRRSAHRMLVFSAGMYILLLCVFITLSTPNFGTLSRYRCGYIPYFVFLLLCSPPVLRILQSSFNRLVLFKR